MQRQLDILVINLKPRWKWFRPPMWKIFRWAYKITSATQYKNCYPVSINGNPVPPEDISFTGTYTPPNGITDDVQKLYYHWLAGIQDTTLKED